jgi:hypothetical protein
MYRIVTVGNHKENTYLHKHIEAIALLFYMVMSCVNKRGSEHYHKGKYEHFQQAACHIIRKRNSPYQVGLYGGLLEKVNFRIIS